MQIHADIGILYVYDLSHAGDNAPPSYSELFPVKELKAEVNHAREDGVTPSVPLKICEMFCKSSKSWFCLVNSTKLFIIINYYAVFLSVACGICYLILALLPISMIVMGK